MTTTVTGKNQVTIPAAVAKAFEIRPGCRLEWSAGKEPGTLIVRIRPDPARVAAALLGAGRKHLRRGADPVGDLIDERTREDVGREGSK